ncbi:MAG TPA: hypothetical protein VK205_00705 [Prolixibacteraceae bacterium]|nr:hypothetical protein [Prolixibacteraceae bacterium]
MNILNKLLIILCISLISCSYPWTIEKRHHRLLLVRNFKNQGEVEDYNTKQVFRKEYKLKSFESYTGEIQVYKNEQEINFKFDSALIILNEIDSLFSPLFTSKLIQPEYIGCNSLSGHSISIEELKDLETKHKKRFKLYVWQPNWFNPQVVLIELTNTTSNKNADLSEFIKGADLTFVYLGWIII